jgi:hypothetical protein
MKGCSFKQSRNVSQFRNNGYLAALIAAVALISALQQGCVTGIYVAEVVTEAYVAAAISNPQGPVVVDPWVAYLSISSKTIDGTTSANEIPYGSSVIVVTTVKLTSNADPGYPEGPIIGFEYWDYDAFNKDDLLLSEQTFQVPLGKLVWSHDVILRCTSKGELVGDGEVDDDDYKTGKVRKYEIYAVGPKNDIVSQKSGLLEISCVPPAV